MVLGEKEEAEGTRREACCRKRVFPLRRAYEQSHSLQLPLGGGAVLDAFQWT